MLFLSRSLYFWPGVIDPRQDVLPGRMGAFISVNCPDVGAATPSSTIAFSLPEFGSGSFAFRTNSMYQSLEFYYYLF
jgi:hypothetical protein